MTASHRDIEEKAAEFERLYKEFPPLISKKDKLQKLKVQTLVKGFFEQHPEVEAWIDAQTSDKERIAIFSVIAIGEGTIAFQGFSKVNEEVKNEFLKHLVEVEEFYAPLGGIIGYHYRFLSLLSKREQVDEEEVHYEMPGAVNLSLEVERVREFTLLGIDHLPELAHVFPVGGAGDRLSLVCEETKEALPAACLKYAGFSLLQHLIRDVQALEYLYYKVHGRQLTMPIVMMTSREKHNHQHILTICEENSWFLRDRESFKFIIQPLAPLINLEGRWVFTSPMKLKLKPGGHGVIWKLMEDASLFDELIEKGYCKFLTRQINNPVASVDYGLLAFVGYGFLFDKTFGFAATDRPINASEGMLVLKEKKAKGGYTYGVTNIEYTDLKKKGIPDKPVTEGSKHSRFPANTNILFGDLKALKEGVNQLPFPGMLINMKTKSAQLDADGKVHHGVSGRIETTMQNVADLFVDTLSSLIDEEGKKHLKTYLTYNLRRKTLASTKKSFQNGEGLEGTPPGCYYEQLLNAHELLRDFCGMVVPPFVSTEEYLEQGPNLIFLYHPSLGPLYQVIGQKLRGGKFAQGSELQLEIAEVDIEELELNGSLLIRAAQLMGKEGQNGILTYGSKEGRCTLSNVHVENRGIDRKITDDWWKNTPERQEKLEIVLEGNSEFVAENVTFKGDRKIIVPDGHKVTAKEVNGQVELTSEYISTPSWEWKYVLHDDKTIKLIS